MTSVSELLPCPFCGGEAQVASCAAGGAMWAQVECVERDCGAVGPTPDTEAQAVAGWNARAALANTPAQQEGSALAAGDDR